MTTEGFIKYVNTHDTFVIHLWNGYVLQKANYDNTQMERTRRYKRRCFIARKRKTLRNDCCLDPTLIGSDGLAARPIRKSSSQDTERQTLDHCVS